MECILRPIHKYPFDLNKENNALRLSYTCFADQQTADLLEIQSHGYRFVVNQEEEEIILLVIRDCQLVLSQVDPVLHVPFNVLRKFSEPHPRVLVIRKMIEMTNFFQPKLQEAKEVNIYFNSNFDADQTFIKKLSQSPFVFKTGEFYLDLKWFSSQIPKIQNIKTSLQMQQHLNTTNQVVYFRVYIESGDNSSYFLFKNGATRVNIKHIDLHPFNIYSTIHLDKNQRDVFLLQPYQEIQHKIVPFGRSNQIILLQTEADIGVGQFLHRFTQKQMGLNYYQIDCNELSSTQQFFRKLNWITNLQNSLVLVKNIDWMMELYQSEQILTMEMKLLMSKIQSQFKSITKKTMRNYILVLEYEGSTIAEDMFLEASSFSLKLEKPMKLFIFKQIFDHFQSQHPNREQVVQHCHDKFGWQIFKTFMTKDWQRIRDKQIGDIIKEVSKLVKQQQVQNLIEVSWDDVGGLQNAKEEIIQTILLPIRHPQIFDEWIKPRTGLLFYGPPGTGKTLLGKCIAKQCKMSFISVKGPELLNMYVGQSQKNVRQVFERAIACKPCIVFMDELDALIPKRGNSGDSHAVMDRIVAQLLMQMDIASSNQVFIIGATNRPDLLDPSILRPGRFDKQIYLGITTNKEDRVKILKAQTRHLTLQEDLDWFSLLDNLPENLTGADFYGLTSKAVMASAQRAIKQYQMGIDHQKIKVSAKDFLQAAQKVKPSVTEADLQRYDQLKKIYS